MIFSNKHRPVYGNGRVPEKKTVTFLQENSGRQNLAYLNTTPFGWEPLSVVKGL